MSGHGTRGGGQGSTRESANGAAASAQRIQSGGGAGRQETPFLRISPGALRVDSELKFDIQELGWFSLDQSHTYASSRPESCKRFSSLPENMKGKHNLLKKRSTRRDATQSQQTATGGAQASPQRKLYALSNLQKFAGDHRLNGVYEFVCLGSTLTRIMTSPYRANQGWTIWGKKINNKWYLSDFRDEQQPSSVQNIDEILQMASKFEEIMTVGDKTRRFYRVVTARFGQHSLLYSGEIDCIARNGDLIELKIRNTSPSEDHHKAENDRRTWAQATAMGVSIVVTGCYEGRSKCFLEKAERTDVRNIESRDWEKVVCLNFLDSFLKHLQEPSIFKTDVVYEFSPDRDRAFIIHKELDPQPSDPFPPRSPET